MPSRSRGSSNVRIDPNSAQPSRKVRRKSNDFFQQNLGALETLICY